MKFLAFRKNGSIKTASSVICLLILIGISLSCFARDQIEFGIIPFTAAAMVFAIFMRTKPTLESVKEELADIVFYNMKLRPTVDVGIIVKAVIALKTAKHA